MNQTRAVMNQRVNAMGISEATVSLEGDKRLRVEMPGVENADEAIKTIGTTAQLRFLLADGTEIMTGDDVADAGIDTDSEHGGYKIVLQFTSEGSKKFAEATAKAASGTVKSTMNDVQSNAVAIMLDNKVLTAPTVKDTITSTSCEITQQKGIMIMRPTPRHLSEAERSPFRSKR